jgi:hypothetical protein
MEVVATVIASLVVVAAVVVLLFAVLRRERFWTSLPDYPPGPEGEDTTGVREPRRPLPSGSAASAMAVPDESDAA